jgi:hypothetical protein
MSRMIPGAKAVHQIDPADIDKVRLSVRSFGFGRMSGAIAPSVLRELQEEAEQRLAAAALAEQTDRLKYRARVVSLGPRVRDFLCSRQMLDLLSAVFQRRFVLTEQRSCLTFYQAGDHLGPHLDEPAEECVVTILVYLAAVGPAVRTPRTGLELRVYGETMPADGKPRVTIPTHTGEIVIGHGSKVWHERPVLEAGEHVTAVTGCYSHADLAADRP